MCAIVVASHLEWETVTNGLYKIKLTLYLDADAGELGHEQQKFYLFKNDKHWERDTEWRDFASFDLDRISSIRLEQDTVMCAGAGPWDDYEGQRHVFLSIYEKTISIPELAQYPCEAGYVIAWHSTGDRTGGETGDRNFQNPSPQEWVATFIPPLTMNGVNVRNSTPEIGGTNTFFLCKDRLSLINLTSTDRDGDILKFRLSKPYGIETYSSVGVLRSGIFTRDFTWAPGYDDQNQMHGNPGFAIDENTGQLMVNPSEKGQYFIGISIDEYRNGQKIGSVSFYYTLTVVDCNEQQELDKDIYQDTTAIQSLTICEGAQATLTSKQAFPNPQPDFQWTKNGKIIWGANSQSITIKEEGNYQLVTTNINGCPDSFDSETVRVSVMSSSAEMDSIPPICDTTLPISLNATPPGGIFAGTGVTGSTFDPKTAGEGTHEIQYVIEGSEACPASVAKREVVVSQAPVIDLVDILHTSRNKPIQIGAKDSLDVAYRWTPPDYLNDVTYANPTCTPSAGITYLVTATNAYGCVGRRGVKIKITENILIPDAFTPNNDGINETWELKGIEDYPKCQITIYNRWGEVIFHSVGYQHAFDGTVAGALQMPGVYAYKIRLTENSPELTGSLTLIR